MLSKSTYLEVGRLSGLAATNSIYEALSFVGILPILAKSFGEPKAENIEDLNFSCHIQTTKLCSNGPSFFFNIYCQIMHGSIKNWTHFK